MAKAENSSAEGLFSAPPATPRPATAPAGKSAATASASHHLFHAGQYAPLAARMHPQSLDQVVGQDHLLGEGQPLRRLIEGAPAASVILYGPPGTGKTTIASLLSQATGHRFVALSALQSGVKELREVIAQASAAQEEGTATVLFIDEVHRFSKTQQDALLDAVERGKVTLVAATTENPSFSVVAPLLSRSLLLQLHSLDDAAVGTVITQALESPRGLQNRVTLDDAARDLLVQLAAGDARRALTYLEACAEAVGADGTITCEVITANVQQAVTRYDRDGDQHYDITSAFIKSIRGSDVDAALHYLARMIAAGEDPRFIARRLVIHASEDIGMADPQAMQIAASAAQAVQLIGMPEGRIPLAQATIYLATAPKSNSVIQAIDAALADVHAGKTPPVPPHLRDGHYSGAQRLENAVGYRYPHDVPEAVVAQRYMPEGLDAQYYEPTDHGMEKRIQSYLPRLRRIIHANDAPASGSRAPKK